MPTELELIALDTEFNLYLPFSKRLVLDLPNSKDRARAAQWLQFLRQVSNDNMMKLRNEHLKLLLFALHRRAMVGIFGVKPPPEELESFHDGLTLLEMTRELIELTEKKSSGDGDDKTVCPLPPVWTNFSFDLKEYSAMQHIPKFGAHVYYAVSNEPIQMWKKSLNGCYPAMGDIPNTMQWEQRLAQITDHVLEKEAEVDRKMEVMKLIEKGEATEDDLEPPQDPSKKPRIETCKGIVFKWKKNSILQLYQKYDFTEIKDIDNLLKTGTEQLELDEDAFDFMNRNLPGRQKIYVREPYFSGLPKDIIERKAHGVEEVIPNENCFADIFPDECDGPVRPKPVCPMGRLSPKRFGDGCGDEQVSEEETEEDSCQDDDQNSCCNQEDEDQIVNPCCQGMNDGGNECNVLFDNSGFDDTCCSQNQNEAVMGLCQIMEQNPCGERPRTAEPYGANEPNPCEAMRPRTADCCGPQRVESGLCQNHGGPPNFMGMYGGPQESHDQTCQCNTNQMNGSMRKPRSAPRNDTINAGCESHNNIQANRCQSQASVNSGPHAASCMRNGQRRKSQTSIQNDSGPTSCQRHGGGAPGLGSASNFRRPQPHRGVPEPPQPVQDMNFYPMIHHNQKHCIQGQYGACCPFCKSVTDLSK